MTVLFFQSLEEKKTHSSSVRHLMQQITSSVIAGRRFLKAGSLQLCCLFSPCEGSVANSCYGSVLCLLCLRDSTIYTKPKKSEARLNSRNFQNGSILYPALCGLLCRPLQRHRSFSICIASCILKKKVSAVSQKQTKQTNKQKSDAQCSSLFVPNFVWLLVWGCGLVLFLRFHTEMSVFSV